MPDVRIWGAGVAYNRLHVTLMHIHRYSLHERIFLEYAAVASTDECVCGTRVPLLRRRRKEIVTREWLLGLLLRCV